MESKLENLVTREAKDPSHIIRNSAVLSSDHPADNLSRASVNEILNISLALNDRHQAKARAADYARERVEAGTYGMCLSCEDAIAPSRLKALPEAEHCIDCQRKQEVEEAGDPTTALSRELEEICWKA